MSSTPLIRWSGAALFLGGLVCALSFLFHPLSDSMNDIVGPRWLIVHNLAGIALLLIVPGLAGLYRYISERSGTLGLTGFVLASIAGALMAGSLIFIESVVLPVAAANPAFAPLADPTSDLYRGTWILPVFLGASLIFALGFVLLGAAILRAGEVPRFSAYLIIVGGFLSALPVPPAPVIVVMIGVFLFGVGLAVVGYVLWQSTSQKSPRSKMVGEVQA
jgi:hypothetical protein